MANRNERVAVNAAGRFYVDTTCIDCDLCRMTAPRIFKRDDELGQTYVYHQPVTEDELAEALQGMTGCPTDSIGDDGERI